MAAFQLHLPDARLVALAIHYHLGRPGSETDAATLQRHSLGLGPVLEALEPRLDGPAESEPIEVDLSAYQVTRLGAALHGTVNELKQFGMADGRSAVPGFAEAFGRLFPETAEGEALDALDLVPDAVGLRRRLADAVREAEAEVEAAREAAVAEAERQRRGPLRRLLDRLGALFGRGGS
ncbi:MAG: hypothetical protein F4Z08_01450 [Chloroflexi bacterium]|nr:hypothetical protein [Chloroflexota bacterium]